MIELLKKTKKVFMWMVEQMPDIESRVACHKLDIHPYAKHVHQKPRRMAPGRNVKIGEEVNSLQVLGLIRPKLT